VQDRGSGSSMGRGHHGSGALGAELHQQAVGSILGPLVRSKAGSFPAPMALGHAAGQALRRRGRGKSDCRKGQQQRTQMPPAAGR
jgi:hypothetical protein